MEDWTPPDRVLSDQENLCFLVLATLKVKTFNNLNSVCLLLEGG